MSTQITTDSPVLNPPGRIWALWITGRNTMLDADTFATAVVARVQELDHPRDVIALAIEAVALRGVLVSVMDLTDLAEATLIGGDPEVVVPIAEVLAAVRDRISVGMATVADIVGRVASC